MFAIMHKSKQWYCLHSQIIRDLLSQHFCSLFACMHYATKPYSMPQVQPIKKALGER